MTDGDADEAGAAKFDCRSDTSFRPVWLDFATLSNGAPEGLLKFATDLRGALDERRKSRYSFYNGRRRDAAVALEMRKWLAWLGAAGIVLTAAATAARFGWEKSGYDRTFLILTMFCYAGMAGIAFYERSLSLASAYFRHVGILLAMRDVWTRFQFEVLAELCAAAAGGQAVEAAARDRIAALAQAAWNDIEALTRGEQESWQGEVLASLKELATVADSGRNTVEARLAQMEKDVAAADLVRAERAAGAARAKAPALLTLSIKGSFDGPVAVSIDDELVANTAATEVSIKPRPATPVHVTATATGKDKTPQEGALNIELKPGLQTATLVLEPVPPPPPTSPTLPAPKAAHVTGQDATASTGNGA